MSQSTSPSQSTAPSPAHATSHGVVDKSATLSSGPQYHVGVTPDQIADVVLMPGDPFRVALVAEQLDDAVEVAHQREYRTVTGTYKGRRITVCSSGMGCPSTAIGVEELARAGATTFIRVGSSAGLQPGVAPGDLLVSEGAVRGDGTSAAYVPAGYPAVPDIALTAALSEVAAELAAAEGIQAHSGINYTSDAFYAEGPELITSLQRLGVLNIEMEAAAMFVVARQRGLRAGMVCACSGNLVTGDVEYSHGHERLARGWRLSVTVALDAVIRLGL